MAPTDSRKPPRRRVSDARQKVSGSLKTFADIQKTGGLLSDIQTHRMKEAAKNDRRQDVVHPSEMAKADWCPRATYYRIRDTRAGTPLTPEKFGVQMDNIFEEGHSIHRKWQGWLTDMCRLWGTWMCEICEHTWIDTSPEHCPNCDSEFGVLYQEVPLDAEESHLIIGHADGGVRDIASMIEIKSIGVGTLRMEEPGLVKDHTKKTIDGKSVLDLDGLWKAIRRPLAAHVRQANVYLWLAAQLRYPFTKMVFLYEYKATQAVKQFEISLSNRIVDPLIDSALDIKYALSGGRLPDRPPFAGKAVKTCLKCPFATECWSDTDAPKRRIVRRTRLPQDTPTAGEQRDPPPTRTGLRSADAAQGHHEPGRPGPDGTVRGVDPARRVPRGDARRSGDRRTGGGGGQDRRRGQGGRPALGRENSGSGQSEDRVNPRRTRGRRPPE